MAIARADGRHLTAPKNKVAVAYFKKYETAAAEAMIDALHAVVDLGTVSWRPNQMREGGDRILGWLVALRPKNAVDVPMRVLTHEDCHIGYKRQPAEALGHLKHTPAVGPIVELLTHTDEAALKRVFADALWRPGDPIALETLQRERDKASSPALKKSLDRAIAKLAKA